MGVCARAPVFAPEYKRAPLAAPHPDRRFSTPRWGSCGSRRPSSPSCELPDLAAPNLRRNASVVRWRFGIAPSQSPSHPLLRSALLTLV
jgi:hypothetical protein